MLLIGAGALVLIVVMVMIVWAFAKIVREFDK